MLPSDTAPVLIIVIAATIEAHVFGVHLIPGCSATAIPLRAFSRGLSMNELIK